MANKMAKPDLQTGLVVLGILLFFLSGFGSAAAQTGPALNLTVSAKKEVKQSKEGRTITALVPLDKAVRSDILLYEITYFNGGKTHAVDPSIIDPVPPGTAYIADSAYGKGQRSPTVQTGGKHSVSPRSHTWKNCPTADR